MRTFIPRRAVAVAALLLAACGENPCKTTADCTQGKVCSAEALCCSPPGTPCGSNPSNCCSTCSPTTGLCACLAVGAACRTGADCCTGVCAVGSSSTIADDNPNRCMGR